MTAKQKKAIEFLTDPDDPVESRNIYMSDERYFQALHRIRKSIVDGMPLRSFDSDAMGDKHNECTWGLCSDLAEHWPDPEDHLWPEEFKKHGRVAPLYLRPNQLCPLDQRMQAAPCGSSINWGNGCFWTCRIFRPGEKSKPTREEVLALYDQAIERIQTNPVSGGQVGNVTAEDKA